MVEESAENLSDAICPPLTVKLGGKEFTVSPLSPYDLAEAESYYIAGNLNNFLENTQIVKGVILPDSVRGIAIAEIMNRTVALDDVLVTYRGKVHFIYLSLKKLTPGITLESMSQLDPMDVKVLDVLVAQITGLMPVKEEDGKDPLEIQSKTSMGEDSDPTSQTGGATFQG